MKDLGFRNIWISLAVVMIPLAVPMALVRFSDEARTIILISAYLVSMIIFKALDSRELRRRGIL